MNNTTHDRPPMSESETPAMYADFEGYSMKNAPPPRVGIQSLQILQNHYPERLALAVCYHPPWLFQIMYKACSHLNESAPVDKGY